MTLYKSFPHFALMLFLIFCQFTCFAQKGMFSSKKSSFSIYLHENVDSVYFLANETPGWIKASYVRQNDTLKMHFTNYKYQSEKIDSLNCTGFFLVSNIDCCFQLGNEVIQANNGIANEILNWNEKHVITHSEIDSLRVELPDLEGCYQITIKKDGLLLLKEDNRSTFYTIVVKNERKIFLDGKKYKLRK